MPADDRSEPRLLSDDARLDTIAQALEALAALRPWRAGPATPAEVELHAAVDALLQDSKARSRIAAEP